MSIRDMTDVCPFCGKDLADWKFTIVDIRRDIPIPKEWTVECLGCGATGPSMRTKVEAIDSWNERKK